ncbi:MAG: hypothetical protein A2898_04910 [Candidatus Kerfeldbacteria bacterium RIFCSPLOWO2_01_FULL_48_11]|uniref:Uncharacterized protein n=1 Tax=Candidatus Kerfeldbacteria bacterium RIFCSPLOWO2_01_FULL_48_11 TaxID=1798543 RepID=A0A1G2B126_9BACT|nr:MAG: hypothetical protein UY34_C0039G0011 [Parcubacteria group bacterium GW2011_GWA2_48_9]KKW15673.1 MAG: hypothetical protein UY52_C0016G0050 [Parcubacteria group bacterium GW2011_GWC2_49_9]OGY82893.1 MAG: hypothetical protein A2898_04910 [Candidatus Kerfeldbacteria bacterium RIFCSPLOWO2_01_FULL_48_11]HCJ52788.1 hypothetical protein [Candidatus Kerfeldbacteria bacterium]
MQALLFLFLPLIVQLAILYFLSQATERMVMRWLGRGWYLATQWPGVIVHELSHLVGCLVTFTRVHEVKLFAPSNETLGYVSHSETHNPIKNVVISIAPLFGVTFIMWLLVKFFMPALYVDIIDPMKAALTNIDSFQHAFSTLGETTKIYLQYFDTLLENIDFGDWKTYIFLYFMVTLACHAAPSSVDMKHALGGIIGLMVLFGIIFFIGNLAGVDILRQISVWASYPILFLSALLSYGVLFSSVGLIVLLIPGSMTRLVKKPIV